MWHDLKKEMRKHFSSVEIVLLVLFLLGVYLRWFEGVNSVYFVLFVLGIILYVFGSLIS